MSLFSRGDTSALQARVTFLEELVTELRREKRELQDALLSATAPEVYRQKLSRLAEEESRNDPEIKFRQDEQEFHARCIKEMEAPAFRSPDEFLAFVQSGDRKKDEDLRTSLEYAATQAPDMAGHSLHNNSES